MLELLISVIGLGLASTLSPVILAISVSLLTGKENESENGSNKPLGRLIAFTLGGVVVAVAIALAGAEAWNGALSLSKTAHAYARQLDFALALALLAFGVWEALPLFRKTADSEKAKKEKRQARIASSGALALFAIGFLVNATNFDAVLFNLAAVREIAAASISDATEIALIGVADFFFLAPCLLPLFVYVAAPKQTKQVLAPVGRAMQKYGAWLVPAIFIVFGLYLFTKI